MTTITVRLHCVATDGYPDMDRMVGRVAFIFDGCVVSGWPIFRGDFQAQGTDWPLYAEDGDWVADEDVGNNRVFRDVTHWVEFPEPLATLERKP